MDSKKMWRIGIAAAIVLVMFLLVYVVRDALAPVFLALVLAYLLDPVVDRMESWKINRSVSIIILATMFVITVVLVGGFLIVKAGNELAEINKNKEVYIERVKTRIVPLADKHLGMELNEVFDLAQKKAEEYTKNIKFEDLKRPLSVIWSQISSSLALMFGLALVPVFLFYFLRDWDVIKYDAADYVPVPYREYVVDKAKKIDEILSAFLRGQLTICIVLGVLYSIGLMIVGVDLAVVIGMLAGLAFIIPYLGTVLGVVAALVMSLIENGLSLQLLGVAGVFGVVQLFEGTLLTPKIMGDKVGLNPVTVIIALLIGSQLLGLLGMLVAVPAAAVIKVFFEEGLVVYRDSEFFKGDGSDTDTGG